MTVLKLWQTSPVVVHWRAKRQWRMENKSIWIQLRSNMGYMYVDKQQNG